MTKKQEPKQYIISEELLTYYKNMVGVLARSKQQLVSASDLGVLSVKLAKCKQYIELVVEKKEEKEVMKMVDKEIKQHRKEKKKEVK